MSCLVLNKLNQEQNQEIRTDFYDFFSFDLKSSSESNWHGLEFIKFQERVELEYDITVFP